MWINDKKVKIENLVAENGLIIKIENALNMKGLGDSTIFKCTFENGVILDIEVMPEEFKTIASVISLGGF